MKNIFKKALPLALSALMLAGCEKEYLETVPKAAVPNDLVFSTTDGATVALNGIYRSMWTSWDGRHDLFGQKAFDIKMDLMGEDLFTPIRGYGWFISDYNLSSTALTGNTSFGGGAWRYYYRIINNANMIIANIDNATGTDAQKQYIKGNALALRAYSYYYLVNLFQHHYKGNENKPGVPIYTEPTTVGKPRATVQEVYNQVIADLNAAEGLLEGKTKQGNALSHINGKVVKGLHARVALQMGDYTKAATKANEARQGYSLMSTTQYKAGFGVANGEWMWGLAIPNDQSTIYASFFSHMDNTVAGYAGLGNTKLMTSELYDKISAGDVRKEIVKTPIPNPTSKDYRNYASFKFILPTAGAWNSDYLMMRSSEMFLIEAEALARTNRVDEARTVLETLVKSRFAGYSAADKTTAQALINEILLQRRIELWGEGFRLFDLKRTNTNLNRQGGLTVEGKHDPALALVLTRDITDNKFLLAIPQSEIDANESITAADQNPQ
jgi:starch-binding outer membrane protein, SusD/RagB family